MEIAEIKVITGKKIVAQNQTAHPKYCHQNYVYL